MARWGWVLLTQQERYLMRQILYVSTSHIGADLWALDALTVQASVNNQLAGVTGLLWTDGNEFSQVIEGSSEALERLMIVLCADPRHSGMRVVADKTVMAREYGQWSMQRPALDSAADGYELRMLRALDGMGGVLSSAFSRVVRGSRAAEAAAA